MISFKANFISQTNIYTKNDHQEFPVSFVELNPFDKYDRKAVKLVAKDWRDGLNNYSTIISQDMEDELLFLNGEYKHTLISKDKTEPFKYYALTSQTEDFELLDFRKILALADIHTFKNYNRIRFLQSHPEHNMLAEAPKFRLIGTAMLNCLKKLFPLKNIILSPTEYSKVFYQLNGFTKFGKSEMIFRHLWQMGKKL